MHDLYDVMIMIVAGAVLAGLMGSIILWQIRRKE